MKTSFWKVWLACTALFAAFSQVTWKGLSGHSLGGNIDFVGSIWLRYAIRRGLSDDTVLTYFPHGYDVLSEMTNFLDVILSLPLDLLLPAEVAYAIGGFLVAGSTGAGAYVLARALAPESRWGPWVAAVLATFSPFVVFELQNGRPIQALLAFNLLFLACLVQHLREPSRNNTLRMGLWLGLAGLTYWFNAYFLVLIALPLLTRVRGPHLPGGLMAFGLAIAMVALPLGAVLKKGATLHSERGMTWGEPIGASLLELPGRQPPVIIHTFSAEVVGSMYGPGDPNPAMLDSPRGTGFYVPWMLLALGLLAAIRRGGETRALVIGVVILQVLSLGPLLKMGGEAWMINGAYIKGPHAALYQWLPGFSRLWFPYRLMGTGLAALAACAAPALAGMGRPVLLAAVAGLIELAVRGTLPLPAFGWCEPDYAVWLAQQEGDGAVFDIPAGIAPTILTHQLVHERPMAGGVGEGLDPMPDGANELRNTYPAIHNMSMGHPIEARHGAADIGGLYGLGYRYAVIHTKRQCAGPDEPLRRSMDAVLPTMTPLLGEPVYETPSAQVYALQPKSR